MTSAPGPETLMTVEHLSLRVPHNRLTVTALRQRQAHDGVAYTATLRLDGKKTGTVENHGCGGPTHYYPDPVPGSFTYYDLEKFAAKCRNEIGGPVSSEEVLDALVNAYDLRRTIASHHKRGLVLCRKMKRSFDGTFYADEQASYLGPTTGQAARLALTKALTDPIPVADDEYWRFWNEATGQWIDLTPRPSSPPHNG